MANQEPWLDEDGEVLIDEDGEVRELTAKDFARFRPFSELPESLQTKLKSLKRGAQKEPTKELISIRLSRDVVQGYRATGPGWQSRVDSTLRESLKKQKRVKQGA